MDKQQIANLLRIQHASRTDKLVVFVGAGVSQNSGIPTWKNLICSMMEELPSELSKENDVLKLAQMYKDSRGHKEYMDKIKNVLLYNKAVPNPLHKSIIALNPCHIITCFRHALPKSRETQSLTNRYSSACSSSMPSMTFVCRVSPGLV